MERVEDKAKRGHGGACDGTRSFEVVLPDPSLSMRQDVEWCTIRRPDGARRVRFHDYDEIYAIPGLYERLFRDVLQCN